MTNIKIAASLDRTAAGDGYDAVALLAAKDLPGLASGDQALLRRYLLGWQSGTDHLALATLAIQIRQSRPTETGLHFSAN